MRALLAVLLMMLAPAWVAAEGIALTAEEQAWIARHPVVRVAIDPQQRSEVRRGVVNPLMGSHDELIAKHSGLRFEYVQTAAWSESVAAFKAGRVDILPSMFDGLLLTCGLGEVPISEPYYQGQTVLMGRRGGPAAPELAQLAGKTVAYKAGSTYEAWLEHQHPDVRRLPMPDMQAVLAAVESGVADAAIGMDLTYHPLIRQGYAHSLGASRWVEELPVSVRIAVQADRAILLSIINKSLASITADERAALVDRWMEVAYLRVPSVSLILMNYGTEALLGALLLLALLFALYRMHRARQASRCSEKQKAMLLAVMSHEVRNAVNAVSSSIELLAHTGLEGEQHELLTTAQTSSRNLQCLLSNALDYTRAEAKVFTPALVACDVLAVARHCMDAQRPAIEAKGLQVKLDLPCGPLPYLMLDETRLRQVLNNLLGNAVKFTTQGHVGIALWQEPARDGKDGLRLVVEVYDTGLGIPADQQHTLFKPFTQAHGPLATQLGGSGLGLSICQEIVARLGGKLSLTSEVGIGTSVRIELPTGQVLAVEDDDVADSEPVVAPVIVSGQHGKVLLVEDHPANRKIIQAQLHHLGYDTTAVDHGQAAIDAFRASDYVAVLLDGELPGMSGYQVAVVLRELEASQGRTRVPLVAISATQGDAHRQRCEMSGIDVVLGKPLSIEQLQAVLASSAGPMDVEEDASEPFVQEARKDLLAIRAAIASGEWALAAHHAHRIKGSTLIFSDQCVQALARDIEQILFAWQPIDSERVEALLTALEDAL